MLVNLNIVFVFQFYEMFSDDAFKHKGVLSFKLFLLLAKPSFEDVRSCLTLQDVDGACEVIHRLLDELPLSNTFILDIICVCDKVENQ